MQRIITKDKQFTISGNLMDLLPRVLNKNKENFKITPSEFIKEMTLTTEERHKKLIHTANMPKVLEKMYPPEFKVLPNILMFQKFEPGENYSVILEVKNVGKGIVPLKMSFPTSIYFSADFIGAPMNKLASGLGAEFKITFMPTEAKDYNHYIAFQSKETTFCVPIIAIGPRPMLDIPDQIVLNPAPVKIATSKAIVVRNIGNAPAVFNFLTQSSRFQVSPAKGILGIHESMLLNISYESPVVRESSELLYLVLETGEKLTITLHGSAENICVRLDKNSIFHDDTYVGLKRCKSVRLTNNSSSVVKFSWKKNKSQECDNEIIQKMKEKYKELTDIEILKDTKVKYYELANSQTHRLSCERILKDELELLEKETFDFSDEAFTIMPQSGEVWPKSSLDIIVAFQPTTCGVANSEAYLEVSGRDSRLPLRIKGNGLGPHIELSVKTLDIDYIYLCSPHKYEVIATNKGDIPGTIEYKMETLVFGGKATLTPESRQLNPGECGVFVISFTSNRQGEFTERLNFIIKESGDIVYLVLKGKIVSPTLHFDIRQIDFGIIPVGFPTVREVTLNNLSVVPVAFFLRILSDGDIPSLSYEQFAKLTIKPPLPQCPKEFHIDPEESFVEPFSSKKVTLTLTANRIGHFLTYLMVDMWDSESGSVSCPISFNGQVATIFSNPEAINIPFCYINFPYTRTITLRNSSKISGFFYIVPHDLNADSTMTCSASIPQGIIEPRSSVNVDITVMTSALGRQMIPINFMIFGHDGTRELCCISCVGQGPVVTVTPNYLHYGEVPLLEEIEKTLVLSNESPIPATLSISLAKPNSPWSAIPSEINLPSRKIVEVVVTLELQDRGKFKDTLKVNVHNGKLLNITMSATGVGSNLKITPNINPRYDLETLFSHQKYEIELLLENKGSKPYSLIWSPFSEFKIFANAKFVNPPDLVFKMEPTKIDVQPGERKFMNLIAQGSTTGYFHQTFYCFANLSPSSKDLHMTSEIFAEFVEPLIEFDKSEVKYWYNIGPDGVEQKIEDEVQVTNVSILPISVTVSTEYPFCLDSENEKSIRTFEMNFDGKETKTIKVKFLVKTNTNRYSQNFQEKLTIAFKDHFKKFSVDLIGEINYPNVVILPKNIDFDHVPVGTNAYREIFLVNVSPLTVRYDIAWNQITSTLTHPVKTKGYSQGSREQLEEYGEFFEENSENASVFNLIDTQTEVSQEAAPPKKPTAKMPEIIISKSDIKNALFPVTRTYYSCDDELMEAYRLARLSEIEDSSCVPEFDKICDITPFYGKLEPYSSQVLAVRFGTDSPVNVHLEAMLSVASGPTEVIAIDGKSDDVDFQLSQIEFDFGKQLFCEPKSQHLKIRNTGAVQFSYEVNILNTEVCNFNDDYALGKGILIISPSTGSIDSFSEADLLVQYNPVMPGRFETKFEVQIAFLDPVIITVKGFGVFPQLYIALPRPDLHDIPPEIGYLAVASITTDWFLTKFTSSCDLLKAYRSQESNMINLSEEGESDLLHTGWEFINSSNECSPSEIDIQLAVERVIAFNLIASGSLTDSDFTVYVRTIPRFYVPPYEIDLGAVAIGHSIQQNVTVTNYGPLPAVVYGVSSSQLKKDGIQVRVKNRSELEINSCFSFTICFNPKKSRYSSKCEKIESYFYFEVYHGPKIPIKICATVTYPHVIPSMCVMNFSEIACGCCKVANLKLKNLGLVTAVWCIAVTLKDSDTQNTKPMFHVNCKSGALYPEEQCCLQVSFKPEYGGSFSASLEIKVCGGLEEITVMLFGEGIEPKLNISKSVLQFGPTTPYPVKMEKTFVLENTCPFPVEFFFPIYDEDIHKEEKILRAVCNYYQTDELLLPVRKPGESLPTELVNFYYTLLDEAKNRFLDQEKERIEEALDDNVSFALSSEDDPNGLLSQKSKKRKMKRSISRSRTSTDTGRVFSTSFESSNTPNILFEMKTSIEVQEILNDYIKDLLKTEPTYDPVQAALKSLLPPIPEEEYREGTLIIFHGAPFTNSAQMANRAALSTNLQVLSIDRIVLEEAAMGRCDAGITAKELIEQAYWDYVEMKLEEPVPGVEWQGLESGDGILDRTDFEEIERKFNALLKLRERLIATKAKNPKTSSAKSETSRKSVSPTLKQMNLNAPIADINESLVSEILAYRIQLEVAQGLIIESLRSNFFNSSIKALVAVLKAAGNTKDILMVFLLNNYETYKENILSQLAEKENVKAQLREELMKILEEEPIEVFESLKLDEQDAEQLRYIFLSQRHEANNLFEMKKEDFYKFEKLKQKDVEFVMPTNAKFESSVDKLRKNKKNKDKKKEVVKGGKTSEVSDRTGSEVKSAKNKRDAIEEEFFAYEAEYVEMMKVIENWDQRRSSAVPENLSVVKMKKGQTPRKTESYQVTKPNDARGVFVWLVDVSKPGSEIFSGVCQNLNNHLQNRLKPPESDTWPLKTVDSMIFSVAVFPPSRPKIPVLDIYTLSAIETVYPSEDGFEDLPDFGSTFSINAKLNRSASQASFKSKKKSGILDKRGRPESRASIEAKNSQMKKSNLMSLKEDQSFKSRWILQPGDSKTFCVRYTPSELGRTEQLYPIDVVNWNNGIMVHCIGVCDVPALDMTPEVMFPNVAAERPQTGPWSAAYFYSDNAYDFGSIVTTSNGKKATKKTAVFVLSNISSLLVDLTVVSAQDAVGPDSTNSNQIQFEPEKFLIKPGEKQTMTVTAGPMKNGIIFKSLMLFVKDNPKIESIQVKCEGVKANVSVDPKLVNFDRLLLQRKDTRRLVLTNNNHTSFYFVMFGLENVPEQFTFSKISGMMEPLEAFVIEVQYKAEEVQLITEQEVSIQVFDDSTSNDPVQELSFALSAEAYDAALDIIFPNRDDDHIDFGDIRVDNSYINTFYLKNMGKYPLNFKIEINHDILDDDSQFHVTPSDGKLLPGKLFLLTVNFLAQNEIDWKRTALFKVRLTEPYRGDESVAAIPINVSARSHFSKFGIKPFPDFTFGHILANSIKAGHLLIENQGHFPFSYFIEPANMIEMDHKSEDITRKSSKPTASSKGKLKAGLPQALAVGAFEITPSSGVVEVGETAVIHVNCLPIQPESYEERVVIFVNESEPHLKNGSELRITAEACLPCIRFDDSKSVFREHFVYANEGEFNIVSKFGSYTLFTEDNKLFSFKNACICKTHEARIHLPNCGLIECNITASIVSITDKESSAFGISPDRLIIEPYTSGTLLLTFRPEAIEVYKARLIITLEMPELMEDQVQTINLFGNGILPEIEITHPKTKLPDGQVLVNFPPTSPGLHSTSSIAFSNVGLLDCRVIIEIYKDQDGVFGVQPKPETEKMLKSWELTKPIDYTAMVSVQSGQTAEFDVTFNPQELKSYSAFIKLFVIDNPFENLQYRLIGDVFLEEVVIEKIRTKPPFLDETKDEPGCLIHGGPGQYVLNFGDCHVRKKAKALLRIVNKTDSSYFRFEWEDLQMFSMFPTVGHLYPDSYKEVLVEFYPEEPLEIEEASLTCLLNKIILKNAPHPSWDSRLSQYQKQQQLDQTFSNDPNNSPFHSSFVCALTCPTEPDFELIPDSSRMLLVSVSGTADYSKLTYEVTKINFKNTFMFQTRTFPLILENPGNVATEYSLKVKSITAGPLKAHKTSQVREDSLTRISRPHSRPASLENFSVRSESSHRSEPNSIRCKRPRPLTCGSFIDFKKITSNPEGSQSDCSREEEISPTYNPFVIENFSGRISPKETVSCNVVFSPMEIHEYKAAITVEVPNLHPDCRLQDIEITAASIMPYCYFNIPESDYLETGRRDYSRPGPIGYPPGIPLHPDTKTIEIKILGIGFAVPIKFQVINPTDEDYTFSWVNTTQIQPEVVPCFHCTTTDGRIQAGRQQLMVFDFVSQKTGISESFWNFCIPKFEVEMPFLLVGDVREPEVYLLSNHINLKPTLTGSTSSDVLTIVNDEEASFEFHFLPDSLYSEGLLNVLKVEPMSGVLPGKSETSIGILFTGKTEGKVLFCLKCKVESIKRVLSVTVEGTTFVVQPLLVFEDLKKVKHHVDPSIENVIDFGTELNLNSPETISLIFTSLSKVSFYYEWEYDEEFLETRHCKIKPSVKTGHVTSFSRGKCDLTILFRKKSSLVNFPVKLKIKRGPSYRFLINASVSIPFCEFSFTTHDFGYCFVQEKDFCFYEVCLMVKNKGSADLVLECYLQDSSAFSYIMLQSTIPPESDSRIFIRFHPKDCVPYDDVLKFIINGLYEKLVTLKGHGTSVKVTLVDPEDTTISLGAVREGKSSIRKFCLKNKSLATAAAILGFSDQLPVDSLCLAQPAEYPVDLSKDHRLSGTITISPSTVFLMKPQEVFCVSVLYTPTSRSSPFTETVSIQIQEKTEPLCILTGCCLGAKISLDKYCLNFGGVVETCTSVLNLKLVNSGSIGCRFEWVAESLGSEYQIFPQTGYCPPESDVTIKVTFRPEDVGTCIKNKAECRLWLSETETYPSLFLDLTGDCVTVPQPIEVIHFKCLVRQMETKTLEIENWSGREWKLIPVFSGECFKGHEALIIPPLSSTQYTVNYCPFTMTEEQPHEGSVFFRLPTGQGLLYHLRGVALPPGPEEVIVREVPCKTKYTELLKVRNWLQHSQRFKVNISRIVDESHSDTVWTSTGFETLEVPASKQREYSLNFFAYKPGTLSFQVLFLNEETKEYVWYDITFNIVMCGPLEVITLRSGVRQTCEFELKLHNPLDKAIQFELNTTSSEIKLEKFHEVPPNQTIYAKLFFTPIHAREKLEKLDASCPELGVFPRELRLVSVDIQQDPPRIFETPLGTFSTQEIPVENLSRLNAILQCRVESEEFMVAQQASVAAGQTVKIIVTHEPSEIGSTSATLFVESEQAGNFVFPLIGVCVKPLAKGPFILKPGSGITIPFKNVFKKPKEFHLYVDNPAFILKSTQENISPKEECKLHVSLQKTKNLEKLNEYQELDPRFPVMGQLVVECFNPYVKWQFYLKGILEKTKT